MTAPRRAVPPSQLPAAQSEAVVEAAARAIGAISALVLAERAGMAQLEHAHRALDRTVPVVICAAWDEARPVLDAAAEFRWPLSGALVDGAVSGVEGPSLPSVSPAQPTVPPALWPVPEGATAMVDAALAGQTQWACALVDAAREAARAALVAFVGLADRHAAPAALRREAERLIDEL